MGQQGITKTEYKYENFIDIQLYKLADQLNPFFYEMGFTPNGITTISALFILGFFYYYKKGLYVEGSICYFISYFFDCMDGSYARRYKMTSKFGEYYDHIKDVIANLITFYLFYKNDNITNQFKKYLIIVFILSTVGNQLYLSCQDKKLNNTDTKVKIPFQCDDPNDLEKLKYVGTGTKYFLIGLMVLLHVKI